jgi:hypothetical protein
MVQAHNAVTGGGRGGMWMVVFMNVRWKGYIINCEISKIWVCRRSPPPLPLRLGACYVANPCIPIFLMKTEWPVCPPKAHIQMFEVVCWIPQRQTQVAPDIG